LFESNWASDWWLDVTTESDLDRKRKCGIVLTDAEHRKISQFRLSRGVIFESVGGCMQLTAHQD
jgi:predicted oxidoreductase